MDVISRKTSTNGNLREMLYADELAVVADCEAGLKERLVSWDVVVRLHCLRVSELLFVWKYNKSWIYAEREDLKILIMFCQHGWRAVSGVGLDGTMWY